MRAFLEFCYEYNISHPYHFNENCNNIIFKYPNRFQGMKHENVQFFYSFYNLSVLQELYSNFAPYNNKFYILYNVYHYYQNHQ